MKKITMTTAPGDSTDSALRIRMGPKGGQKRGIPPTLEINIPFTLMFTDMFSRGVLTPQSEQLFFTKGDDRALMAYYFIHSQTDGHAPDHATIQQIIPAHLILASVVYHELAILTDTYIENIILEMKDGKPVEDDIFFLQMVDQCTPKVNAFMRDPLSKMTDASRIELYQSILKPYAALAHHAAIRKPTVTFHLEVLNSDNPTA